MKKITILAALTQKGFIKAEWKKFTFVNMKLKEAMDELESIAEQLHIQEVLVEKI